MGKRKHKNKEVKNNNENLNNKNSTDFINSNENLNPLELINYLGLSNNSNNLNSNNLLKMIINNKLKNNIVGNNGINPLMDLISNINTDGVNMSDINKLSEKLKNISNPQEFLSKMINNKLNLDNSEIVNDNSRKRRKNKDLDNLEFLKSLRSIVDPSKVEFIDKIIAMYENGEI